jgi:hypothetical protein
MTLFDVLPVGVLAALGAVTGALFGSTIPGMALGFVAGLLISATGMHYRLIAWFLRDDKNVKPE